MNMYTQQGPQWIETCWVAMVLTVNNQILAAAPEQHLVFSFSKETQPTLQHCLWRYHTEEQSCEGVFFLAFTIREEVSLTLCYLIWNIFLFVPQVKDKPNLGDSFYIPLTSYHANNKNFKEITPWLGCTTCLFFSFLA